MKLAPILLAILTLLNSSLYSCTTFCLNTGGDIVFGKNYDWNIGNGLVIVNKRGIDKIAFVSKDTPAKWKSKYGSVTFNQFGREFPNGGMNEAGLVVELMWLEDTKYPAPDERLLVGSTLQWIQYQLDNSATIDDIIESDKIIRISSNSVPIHYLAADKDGNCVSIEFLDGKLVFHKKETMPYQALTNDTYQKSLDNLKRYQGFGGTEVLDNSNVSLERFAKTCTLMRKYNPNSGKKAVEYGFEILDEVSAGSYTKWSIVYDIKNLKMYFKTEANKNIKNIDLAGIDFECTSPVKMLDINYTVPGSVNGAMINYEFQVNRDLIEESYGNVEFLKKISIEVKDRTAQYPEKLTCNGSPQMNTDHGSNSPLDLLRTPLLFAAGFLLLSFLVLYTYKHKKRS
ncbi:MAG: linear amide C-N hydrolase [Ignavibacteria bacterium]|nr:linear amide C-N hydrolase [Ignavibacteria bacterium]